ncbi:MAG TPA: hypothetical protein OIM49_07150 [Clostridiaceae bacterium]|nr:hypothetical protein [Clostridiaceae bacterium]
MKKKIKKIIQMITLFIIGAGGKTFASEQEVYGPPQREIIKENISGLFKNTSGLLTGIISIILFIVGLIVVINKNIKGKVKAIIVSIVVVAIVGLSIYYYSHI